MRDLERFATPVSILLEGESTSSRQMSPSIAPSWRVSISDASSPAAAAQPLNNFNAAAFWWLVSNLIVAVAYPELNGRYTDGPCGRSSQRERP